MIEQGQLSNAKSCSCGTETAVAAKQDGKPASRSRLYILLSISLAAWVLLYWVLQPAADFLTYDLFNAPGLEPSGRQRKFLSL